MSLMRSSAIVGSLTLLSRVFGFVRDMLIAYFLGASAATDAFFVAFKLPNFLRRLFAEGAFNAGFLPMFAGMIRTEGREAALRFASEAGTFLLAVVTAVTALAIVFTPHVVLVMAPGFTAEPEKFDLAVALTRITFPYIVFISMVSLMGGVLNSVERFAAVAAAPIGMNLAMIAGLWLFRPFVPTDGHALAWGVVLAGVVQLVWLARACRREGMMPRLLGRPRLSPAIRTLLGRIAPAAIGAGVMQINQVMDVVLASLLASNAISFLYYADRIYELPLGVIGIAVATALLPLLSKEIRAGQLESALRHINQALMLVLLFGLPAAAGLYALAGPIIQGLFQYGEFDATDTAAVAPALIAFAAGLPALLINKILSNCFYASEDTKTPMKIAVLCIAVNFICNVLFMQFFAHVGLAMATSVAGWLNALLLARALWRRGLFRPDRALAVFLGKAALACLLMIAALLVSRPYATEWLAGPAWQRGMALALLVALGGVVYGAGILGTRAVSVAQLKRLRPSRTTKA
jgi:putative peptidoglycan lipid II flippase